MAIVKENLLYTRSHEWVLPENGLARIGITDHARCELGELVFAEAVPAGRRVLPGQSVGAVESVKVAADILSPLTGEIVESRTTIGDELEQLAADPYDVWFVVLRPENSTELDALMDATAYTAFCATGG